MKKLEIDVHGWGPAGILFVGLMLAAGVSTVVAVILTLAWNALVQVLPGRRLGTIAFEYAWIAMFVLTLLTSRITTRSRRP